MKKTRGRPQTVSVNWDLVLWHRLHVAAYTSFLRKNMYIALPCAYAGLRLYNRGYLTAKLGYGYSYPLENPGRDCTIAYYLLKNI